MKSTLVIFLFTVLSIPVLYSQPIEGRVLDALHLSPLSEVRTSLSLHSVQGISSTDGSFAIDCPEFPATVIFQLPGYEDWVQVLEQAPDEALLILLKPVPLVLDSVFIVAGEAETILRDHAGSITLLRAEELQRDNQLSLSPALNRVPGVQMQQGALNTARISIRGIGARNLFGTAKIRAYFEDIPLTDGVGSTSLEDMDLGFVEQVEVLRGPTSSIYGAGLGGTIRLTANSPRWNQSKVLAGSEFGSFGQRRFLLNARTAAERSSFDIAASNTHVDGFRKNSSYDRSGVSAVGRWVLSEKSSLLWLGQWTSVRGFIPSSIDSATFADEPTAAAFTWNRTQGVEDYNRAFTGLSWRYHYNNSLEHWITVFGGYRDADEIRPFNILRELNLQQGVRARWILRQDSWRVTFGTETFREVYDWQTYVNIDGLGDRGAGISDNEEIRSYTNVFLQARGDLGSRIHWEAGANLNTTGYDYQDFTNPDSTSLSGAYTFDPTISPRVALMYSASQWTARVQLSHGFSPPTLEETLTPEGTINPDILPESGWNLEAGWRGYLIPRVFWLDATVYRMWVSDLLVARRTAADQFIGVNAGKTLHDGLEVALNYRPISRLTLWANYGLQNYQFVEFVDDGDDYSGNDLTGVPPHQLTAGLTVTPVQGLTAQLTSRYVSAIPMRDDNSIYSDPYFLLNARVQYQRTLKGGTGVTLHAGINNLLDTQYASQVLINAGSFGGRAPRYFYPGAPQSWYGGVSFRWMNPRR